MNFSVLEKGNRVKVDRRRLSISLEMEINFLVSDPENLFVPISLSFAETCIVPAKSSNMQ